MAHFLIKKGRIYLQQSSWDRVIFCVIFIFIFADRQSSLNRFVDRLGIS